MSSFKKTTTMPQNRIIFGMVVCCELIRQSSDHLTNSKFICLPNFGKSLWSQKLTLACHFRLNFLLQRRSSSFLNFLFSSEHFSNFRSSLLFSLLRYSNFFEGIFCVLLLFQASALSCFFVCANFFVSFSFFSIYV